MLTAGTAVSNAPAGSAKSGGTLAAAGNQRSSWVGKRAGTCTGTHTALRVESAIDGNRSGKAYDARSDCDSLGLLALLMSRRLAHVAADIEFLNKLAEKYDGDATRQERPTPPLKLERKVKLLVRK
ncbi:MAG: hypothetical protein HY270_05170 [Deltaproteobacteria bacterium]|nr:hypothetical protein [Deltaproteobacteria bacterium]